MFTISLVAKQAIISTNDPSKKEIKAIKQFVPWLLFAEPPTSVSYSRTNDQFDVCQQKVNNSNDVDGNGCYRIASLFVGAWISGDVPLRPVLLQQQPRTAPWATCCIAKQTAARSSALCMSSTVNDVDELNKQIQVKGDKICTRKADGISKDDLAPLIAELVALKAQLPKETEQPKKEAKKQPTKSKKENNSNNNRQKKN